MSYGCPLLFLFTRRVETWRLQCLTSLKSHMENFAGLSLRETSETWETSFWDDQTHQNLSTVGDIGST